MSIQTDTGMSAGEIRSAMKAVTILQTMALSFRTEQEWRAFSLMVRDTLQTLFMSLPVEGLVADWSNPYDIFDTATEILEVLLAKYPQT